MGRVLPAFIFLTLTQRKALTGRMVGVSDKVQALVGDALRGKIRRCGDPQKDDAAPNE